MFLSSLPPVRKGEAFLFCTVKGGGSCRNVNKNSRDAGEDGISAISLKTYARSKAEGIGFRFGLKKGRCLNQKEKRFTKWKRLT